MQYYEQIRADVHGLEKPGKKNGIKPSEQVKVVYRG
jgi:hypothetical protein